MALYIPVSRRRRTAALLSGGALVLGLGIGWVSGQAAAPSIEARVVSVKGDGRDIATRLAALPIEYEQALRENNQIETIQGGVIDTLDGLQVEAIRTLDRAPWIAPDKRAVLLDALAAARELAKAKSPADAFATTIEQSAIVVRSTFGA